MLEEHFVIYQSFFFDCVNLEILLTRLHFYGIQAITIYWFRSYLTNKKQKVEIK